MHYAFVLLMTPKFIAKMKILHDLHENEGSDVKEYVQEMQEELDEMMS